MHQQLNRLRSAVAAAIKPPREISVLEWAEENLRLSKENSSQPGKFTAYPYQREILEALSASHPASKVVAMIGAQMVKTLAIMAAIGYVIDVEQGPILLVEPRERDVESFSADRLDPMLRDTPALQGKVSEKKSRDSGNTKLFKRFNGGSITLVGSNAPANLAMRSIRWLFLDEVDRYEKNKEGDVVSLAMKRQDTYPHNRKLFMCSTPHLEGSSRIFAEYALSDQREYFVPCPECLHMQVLRWAQVKWGVVGDRVIAPKDAHYGCESCRALIPNWKKLEMLEAGKWIPQNPDGEFPGFHLTQLCSPLKSWGTLATEWLQAQGDPEQVKTFVNTVLAETWKEAGDAPPHETIIARAEPYSLVQVPRGVLFLTAGIDVQKDRWEIAVWGWGRNRHRWLVDYVVIEGSPAKAEDWAPLTEAVNVAYQTEGGVDLPIRRAVIDSGYEAEMVYRWARQQGPGRVLVAKGYDRGVALLGIPQKVDVTIKGKHHKWGIKVWPINVSMAKSELYGQIKIERPDGATDYPAGWIHIPALGWVRPTLEEFARQFVAEQFVTKIVKGYKRGEWVNARPGGRNEALDTANLARGGAEHCGISRMQENDWLALEQQMGLPTVKPAVEAAQPAQQPQVTPQRPPVQRPSGGVGWASNRPGGWFSR